MRPAVHLVITGLLLAGCVEPGPADADDAEPGTPGDGGADGAVDPATSGQMDPSDGPAASGDTADGAAVDAPAADLMEAVHRAAWLCQDPVGVADSDPQGSDALTCEVSLRFTDDQVIVTSTGIPNHDLDSGPAPTKAAEQGKTWAIPLRPQMADAVTWAPDRGAIALAANGAAIYGPEEGSGGAAVANQYGYYEEDRELVELGICDGHAGPGGEYHYHADANCMHWHIEAGKTGGGYTWDAIDPTVHSGIIGFAFDGFPIYGSYAWDTGTKDVVEMLSSYRFKTAAEGGQDGYNGMDDFLSVEGAGHLDECNGRFHPTPEFPDGIYAYHSTRHDFQGELGFPHFLMCYRGIVDPAVFGNEGSGAGPEGGSGGDPPPGGSGPEGGSSGGSGSQCTDPDGNPIPPKPDGTCPSGPPPGPP